MSLAPIVITFSGGGPELFNVYAALNGDQASGVLGVLRTGDALIQFSTLVPMGANVTFSFEHAPTLSILGSVNVDGVVQLREPWQFNVVPEPSTFLMAVCGALGLAVGRVRRRKGRIPGIAPRQNVQP